jgi:hypothetical protein
LILRVDRCISGGREENEMRIERMSSVVGLVSALTTLVC